MNSALRCDIRKSLEKSQPLLTTSSQETMYRVSTDMVVKAATPNWLLQLDLTPRLRGTRIAYELLEVRSGVTGMTTVKI